MPNFLLIGAPKSGTTSIYYYLREHPEINIQRGTRFWCNLPDYEGPGSEIVNIDKIRTIDKYEEFYRKTFNGEKAIGDISNEYLFFYNITIYNLKKYYNKKFNKLKFIAILRNPIEAIYSRYLHNVREGWENYPFRKAILKSKERKAWIWDFQYIDIYKYYTQLKFYMNYVNKHNIKIFLYDDLQRDPVSLLKNLYEFLEVNSNFLPNLDKKYNTGMAPKYWYEFFVLKNPFTKILKHILPSNIKSKIKEKGFKKKLSTNVKDKEYLCNIYKDDIFKLQDLINRDLSHWLK